MTRGIRALSVALVVLLGVSTVVLAAPAWSAGANRGMGRLESVEVSSHTVTIGGVSMRLERGAAIYDLDGSALTLEGLAEKEFPFVHFTGMRVGGEMRLDEIRVSDVKMNQDAG